MYGRIVIMPILIIVVLHDCFWIEKAEAASLEVKIDLGADEFLVGEYIQLKVTVVNTSAKKLTVPSLWMQARIFNLEIIRDEESKRVTAPFGNSIEPAEIETALEPGDSLEKTCPLNELGVGKYEISGVLDLTEYDVNDEEKDRPRRKKGDVEGKIRSAALVIEIVMPGKSEEIEALREMYAVFMWGIDGATKHKQISEGDIKENASSHLISNLGGWGFREKIMNEYPNSVYGRQCSFWFAYEIVRDKNKRKGGVAIQILNRLLKEKEGDGHFPTRFDILLYLIDAYEIMGDKEMATRIASQIYRDYKPRAMGTVGFNETYEVSHPNRLKILLPICLAAGIIMFGVFVIVWRRKKYRVLQ